MSSISWNRIVAANLSKSQQLNSLFLIDRLIQSYLINLLQTHIACLRFLLIYICTDGLCEYEKRKFFTRKRVRERECVCTCNIMLTKTFVCCFVPSIKILFFVLVGEMKRTGEKESLWFIMWVNRWRPRSLTIWCVDRSIYWASEWINYDDIRTHYQSENTLARWRQQERKSKCMSKDASINCWPNNNNLTTHWDRTAT